jgi:hypothetical protein
MSALMHHLIMCRRKQGSLTVQEFIANDENFIECILLCISSIL